MGKALIAVGIALLTVGVLVIYAPWLLSWFGRLPGDIRIEGERGGFFFPLTSMIIISVILTVVLNLIGRR